MCRPRSWRNQLLRSVLGKILGFCSWTPTPAAVSSEVTPQGAGETPAGGQISSSARPAPLLLPPTAPAGSARAPRAHGGSEIAAGSAPLPAPPGALPPSSGAQHVFALGVSSQCTSAGNRRGKAAEGAELPPAGGARTALTEQPPQRSGPSRRFHAVCGSLGCVFMLWQGTFREEGD